MGSFRGSPGAWEFVVQPESKTATLAVHITAMISFITQEGWPISGRLLYDGSGFDTQPRPLGCVASVVVNDIELMLNEDDQRALFVTGYCPHQGWLPAILKPPASRRGSLRVEFDTPIVPGLSHRLHPWDEPWPVLVDRSNGWLRLGKDGSDSDLESVELAPGATAVVKGDRLAALWLHPVILEIP